MPEYVDSLPKLPPRAATSHKGTFGRVLVAAGSRGMSGAAALAGRTALRSGAGLVTVGVPEGILSTVAGLEPAYTTVPLPETRLGRLSLAAQPRLWELASAATAVACGPGWGTSAAIEVITWDLYQHLHVPLVLDADALNALAGRLAPRTTPLPPAGPRVLTPHPGEFARLTGYDSQTILDRREELATEFAARHGVVLLLKGSRTVIADGERIAVNQTGNPGMATGGCGDVLTGLIAALLAQGFPPFEAAQLGAHVHGLAGDHVAQALSQPGLTALTLSEEIARAWTDLEG